MWFALKGVSICRLSSSNAEVNMSHAPTYQEIESVIEAFYEKVMHHPQLGHFFEHIEDFSEHQKRIVDFWWISMGGKLEQSPKIDMIGKHLPLGIRQEDLEIWLALFSETLEQQLSESQAIFWLDKAMVIGARLRQIVIEHQPMGVQLKQ